MDAAPGDAGPPAWRTDPDKALAEASETARPLVVELCAAWAMACQELDKELRDPAVARLVADHHVAVRIDVTDGGDAATRDQARFHADAVPTLIVLDASGHELARRVGLLGHDQLLGLLGRVLH